MLNSKGVAAFTFATPSLLVALRRLAARRQWAANKQHINGHAAVGRPLQRLGSDRLENGAEVIDQIVLGEQNVGILWASDTSGEIV